jgi:hypothetical protein
VDASAGVADGAAALVSRSRRRGTGGGRGAGGSRPMGCRRASSSRIAASGGGGGRGGSGRWPSRGGRRGRVRGRARRGLSRGRRRGWGLSWSREVPGEEEEAGGAGGDGDEPLVDGDVRPVRSGRAADDADAERDEVPVVAERPGGDAVRGQAVLEDVERPAEEEPGGDGVRGVGVVAVRMVWAMYARMIAVGSQWVRPRCRMNGSRWSTSGERGPPLVMVATRRTRGPCRGWCGRRLRRRGRRRGWSSGARDRT